MRRCLSSVLFCLLIIPALRAQAPVPAPKEPPQPLKGALVIVGGGGTPDAAYAAFVLLAGGQKGKLVVIPTASGAADTSPAEKAAEAWQKRGIGTVQALHTRSREKADDADFVKPIQEATAVWFGGGDQTKLAEAYGGTRVETELHRLLERGGVIGGTSAGAAIMSRLMIAGGTAVPRLGKGLGLLPNGVIDQHFLKRNRPDRLLDVLHKNPGWFGLGIDEGTAVVVQGRGMTVMGASYAVACLAGNGTRPPSCQFLRDGEKADLVALSRAALDRAREPHPPLKAPVPNVPRGALIIGGGGGMPEEVWTRFLELAGGPEARILFVPTALDIPTQTEPFELKRLRQMGAKNAKVLHARSRAEADSPAFAAEIREASGVWFTGGRQWRLVDAYLDTAAGREFHALLERGGVIGGSSAGASIQADYMVRGDPLGNTKMMAEGYERGLGFLKGVAIDQHFLKRNRTADMTDVMARYPQLLGIGLDEATAIVVRGEVMEVVGKSTVAVYDRNRTPETADPDYELLSAGTRFNLRTRQRVLRD